MCRPRRFEEPAWKNRGSLASVFWIPLHSCRSKDGLASYRRFRKAPVQVLVGSPKRLDAIEHRRGNRIVVWELSGSKVELFLIETLRFN